MVNADCNGAWDLFVAIALQTISVIMRGPWKNTMATRRRAMMLTAFLLQLLMVGATASPLADAINPLGDASRMNADLVEKLDKVDDATVLPVIFQLHSPLTPHDEAFIADLGLVLKGEAPLLDAGLVEGKAIDLRRMSTWDRVEYLELNKELEFFYLPSAWEIGRAHV